ncbi:MAG: DUF2911 domain-containing protein [Candidatus Hydrogenedentota bacterium]
MRTRIAIALLLAMATLKAAAEPAQGSPEAYVSQVIGESDFSVTYSRPGVRGRAVWGDLVPWGEVWRAGANDKTVILFEEDVVITGQRVPKGKYSFYVIPERDAEWTLILNSDWEGHGTEHTVEADVLRWKATPTTVAHEEWLRYDFDALENTGATIYLQWETKRIEFRFEFAPAKG